MVDDFELVPDEVDDPPAGPQARAVAGFFRPRHDQAHQLTALSGRQLWRSAGRGARAKAAAATAAVRPLPAAAGEALHTPALRHHHKRGLTLEHIQPLET